MQHHNVEEVEANSQDNPGNMDLAGYSARPIASYHVDRTRVNGIGNFFEENKHNKETIG